MAHAPGGAGCARVSDLDLMSVGPAVALLVPGGFYLSPSGTDAGPSSPVVEPVKRWVALPPPVEWAPTLEADRGRHELGRRETCTLLLLAFPGGLAQVVHYMQQGC
jgi:hypothetical protein